MAAAEFAISEPVKMPTSTGTWDFTVPGFGTPDAVIFMIGGSGNEDVTGNNWTYGIGFTDGVNDMCVGSRDRDNQGNAQNSRYHSDQDCIRHYDNAGINLYHKSEFYDWITDGVRLSVTTATGTFYMVYAILIKGCSNVLAGNWTIANSSGNQSLTGVGFEPDFVMFSTIGVSVTPPSVHGDSQVGYGIACKGHDSNIHQAFTVNRAEDDATVSETRQYVSTSKCIGQFGATNDMQWVADLTSFDADGLSVDVDVAPGGVRQLYYLALKFDSLPDMEVIQHTLPLSGDITVNTSFEPGFTWDCFTGCVAYDAVYSHITTQMLAHTPDGQSGGITAASEDNQSWTDTKSGARTDLYLVNKSDNSLMYGQSTALTYSGNSYTYTLSAWPATTTRVGWAFVLGGGRNPGAGVKLGSVAIDDMLVGTIPVDAMYQGATQIW